MRLADLKDGDILYDLGCGDGRVVIYAAKNNNLKAVGVEKSFLLYAVCSVKKLFVRNRNIFFKWSDIYKEKYPDADAIFIYPNSSKNALRVYDKICKENGNELKLISYRFSIKDIEPDSVERAPAGLYSVYLYKLNKQYAKN